MVAEGWGSYSQEVSDDEIVCKISLKYGQLNLKEWLVSPLKDQNTSVFHLSINDKLIEASCTKYAEEKQLIRFTKTLLQAGDRLVLKFSTT